MAKQIDPKVYEAISLLRANPGTRVKALKLYDRDAPHLLVSKGTRVSLIRVNLEDSDISRPQLSIGSERWDAWYNLGLPVSAVKFCNTPAEAVEFANSNYVPPVVSPLPPTVLPPTTAPPVGPFNNAFSWVMTGQFDTIHQTATAQRIVISEAENVSQSRRPALLLDHSVLNTDSPRRTEISAVADGVNFKEGATTTGGFEVQFPSDFPVISASHYVGIFRFSANVNGFPPIEFLVKKRADNTEWVYLRHLGTTHDLASETTLDAAGGYIYSTPLLRKVSDTVPNWMIFNFKIHWSDNASLGWIELYRDYDYSTPAMARFTGKTLTDTSGTVRCYARQGINAHSSLPTNVRVTYSNANWETEEAA
jgi:hypothetical protein